MADPKSVLEFVKKNGVKMLDLRFTDLPGLQHHVSYPIDQLSESSFEEGFGMDGSSIRGWAAIHESDMLLIPDPNSYMLDPFTEVPTLVMYGDVRDPITKQNYERDPRWIAQKAEIYLRNTGLADTAYFGAEAEFFIFDNVRFDQNAHSGFYFIDAEEGRWNSGRVENNQGYRPRYKEGYFPVAPVDTQQDIRTEMCLVMEQLGIKVFLSEPRHLPDIPDVAGDGQIAGYRGSRRATGDRVRTAPPSAADADRRLASGIGLLGGLAPAADYRQWATPDQ
jgi:glutamine synthetase